MRTDVRLAELMAALSLGVDLGFGQPMEHVLRQTLVALRLAERLGLDPDARTNVYYTSLLLNVGCHTDAHEQAKWFGDDISFKAAKYVHPLGSAGFMVVGLGNLGKGRPPIHRFRLGLEFAVSGHRELDGMIAHHANMARELAMQLSLDPVVFASVMASYEEWDGSGWPGGLAGDAIPLAARLAHISEYVEVAHRVGGVEKARALARERRGKQFDPELADLVIADPDGILGDLDSTSIWQAVIDSEPGLRVVLTEAELEQALLAIASFVDLKSPFSAGHAEATAELAAQAGAQLGIADRELAELRRAALLQDLGRLGVSNSIWDKPGPLASGEWERVRLHPYLTERMLRQCAALAGVADLAVQHHERLDGSGYPRGLSGVAIAKPARILAAADAYQAMLEPRPHRPALSAEAAAGELRGEVRRGRLDPDAAEAVLAGAGHRVKRRVAQPSGLTSREVDVLRLVARGLSNKQIAGTLVISSKTVSNHVEHIYDKIGASTRAQACYFAVRQGLLPE